MSDIVKWLRYQIVDGRTESEGRAQAADEIERLRARLAEAGRLLREIRPYTDSLICYASTITEHPPNGYGLRIDAFLASQEDKP